eukprot:CAMPEP_0203915748 /NCGR_PEP_ID=MMETSP0359-20131031/56516_1 /ASSEMBLY_ACC=CAM_ASM_000338 /TAXON_ID=268821 /ORGANISM="Scrippsiella Hangoei, Strain SHTV-5" /LENGTH=88 /DNA_ID=CAMNT_0050842311 /DNA_START=94 /DNA_END=356 /DNA_ORIENTATION=+
MVGLDQHLQAMHARINVPALPRAVIAMVTALSISAPRRVIASRLQSKSDERKVDFCEHMFSRHRKRCPQRGLTPTLAIKDKGASLCHA